MASTIQIRLDDSLKNASDKLFKQLGLDTSTAVRIFLKMAVEIQGIPFDIRLTDNSLEQAREDVLNGKNLSRRYKSAKEAVEAMLEDD